MKNKINSYMEYKKEFNELIKNCDLKTNSRAEIKKWLHGMILIYL